MVKGSRSQGLCITHRILPDATSMIELVYNTHPPSTVDGEVGITGDCGSPIPSSILGPRANFVQ